MSLAMQRDNLSSIMAWGMVICLQTDKQFLVFHLHNCIAYMSTCVLNKVSLCLQYHSQQLNWFA